jgi:PTS system arbutin/cellobiose/salicin-specific IIC component
MILAVVLSFFLTLLLGFEDIPVEQSNEKPQADATAPQQAVNAN